MGLKRKRKPQIDDINFKLDEVAVKGQIVTYNNTKTGFVKIQAAVSGVIGTKAHGMLVFDVVDKDFGAVPVNFQRLETGISGFVPVYRVGEVGTDQVKVNSVFGAGSGVFLADSGQITNVQDSVQNERVGTALAAADDDGFVEIFLHIV